MHHIAVLVLIFVTTLVIIDFSAMLEILSAVSALLVGGSAVGVLAPTFVVGVLVRTQCVRLGSLKLKQQ